MKLRPFLALFGICLALSATAASARNTPGYNNKIPPEIMTPDTVQTRIGTLKFFEWVPHQGNEPTRPWPVSISSVVSRCSFNFVPAASIEADPSWFGSGQGLTQSNPVMITERVC